MTEPQPLVVHITGARPNFPKAAPVIAALAEHPVRQLLVHTGQHYDERMSEVFFRQLGLPEPDVNLGVGSGSHGAQTAAIMVGLEELFTAERPDLVVVYGDVNSTVAAALVAAKMLIPLAHVEAGLRSFDMTMPEEVNRVVTDCVASLLFTHSPEARDHLVAEGRDEAAIHAVGNTMIDTLCRLEPRFRRLKLAEQLGLQSRGFVLVTLHRPSLVDGPLLPEVLEQLQAVGQRDPRHPVGRVGVQRLQQDGAVLHHS